MNKTISVNKRKRHNVYSHLKDVIECDVIHKWINYLSKKMQANKRESYMTPRDDTIWKKIFRDCREFYRTLFKARFHTLEYRACEEADKCSLIMLDELGIDASHLTPYEVRKIFYYFHQTRLHSSLHYAFPMTSPETETYAVDVIENYKDSSKILFLVDPICSKLFYFLFANYSQIYNSFLKPKYIGVIDKLVIDLIQCYDNMESIDDLDKVVDILFQTDK
jgi:hypothetical protein